MPNSPGSRSGYWVLGLVLSTKKKAHARTRKTSNSIPHHPAPHTHTHTANGALTARCPLRGPQRSSIFEGGEDAQLTKTAVTGGYRNSTQHASATAQTTQQTTRVHLLAGYTSPCRCWKGVCPQHRAIAAKKALPMKPGTRRPQAFAARPCLAGCVCISVRLPPPRQSTFPRAHSTEPALNSPK